MRIVKMLVFSSLLFCSSALADHLEPYADKFAITLPRLAEMPSSARRNIQCSAINIYHEARGTGEKHQAFVAWVVRNRIKSGKYGSDECETVFQTATRNGRVYAQFAWTIRKSKARFESASWLTAQKIALDVYDNKIKDTSGGALDLYQTTHIKHAR